MLFLDHTQIKYCKLQGQDTATTGIIYNGKIFTRAKAFPKEELEVAIKECREEYLDHEERSKIPTLLIKERKSVGIWMENQRYKQKDILEVLGGEKSSEQESSRKSTSKSTSDISRISIRQIAAQMRSEQGVEIKTRRYKLKLYQRCFLGNEAVDWIVGKIKVSRTDAVKIGQKMIEKGIVNHVTNDHSFKDENLFYRFNEDKGKSIWNSNV
ncbi:MAG: DEP domain-containing protein [Pleurocapsa sp.]